MTWLVERLADLRRQLDSDGSVGTDLGAGWRIEESGSRLTVFRTHKRQKACTAPFAYTLTVPGEILIEELSVVFRVRRCRVEPWMRRGSQWRAGMLLELSDGDRVTIRSRRPGDRIRPFGCDYSKRLKEILIDRKMPRDDRDRLPLLTVDEKIVWVPGVTIDHGVRLTDVEEAWVAEIEPARGSIE